jgi:hypothetical protein
MRPHCYLCVCVSPLQLLNAWTNLYETWYVCHGTWTHLNGVPPISLCVCLCIPLLLLLTNGSVNTFLRQLIQKQQKNSLTVRFLCSPCLIKGESVSLSVYPPIVDRQRLDKHVPAATKNYYQRLFYAVCVISKENKLLVFPKTSCYEVGLGRQF